MRGAVEAPIPIFARAWLTLILDQRGRVCVRGVRARAARAVEAPFAMVIGDRLYSVSSKAKPKGHSTRSSVVLRNANRSANPL